MLTTSANTIPQPRGGNVIGQAARIDALTPAGELWLVRRDLEDAALVAKEMWREDASESDRLTAVMHGLEALLRAVSTLTRVVEQVAETPVQERMVAATEFPKVRWDETPEAHRVDPVYEAFMADRP